MLLGTSCPEGTLHLEPDLVYVEMLQPDTDDDVGVGEPGRLVVTTLGVEGSPLVRFDTGDLVRRLPPCGCGDPRAGIVVLGRAADVVELSGSRLHPYEIIDAAADAADAADSSVFFVVILPDRLLVRIEAAGDAAGPLDRLRERLGVPVEVEMARPNDVLDVELLARSPSVYKPVVTSDWRGGGRRVLSVSEGMIEWPGLSLGAAGRWLGRSVRRSLRRRRLGRGI
jgi:phenylacetate-CoA ligase